MNKRLVSAVAAVLIIVAALVTYVLLTGGYFAPAQTVHDVAVTNVLCTSNVHLGDLANITVTAKNKGTVTETFNVTSYVNNTAIQTQTTTNLGAGAERNLTFTWNTSGAPIANYVVKAVADTVQNETVTTDNTFVDDLVEVRQKQIGLAELYVDPPSIQRTVGENFTIGINVSNFADLYGYEFKLSWNGTVLEAVNVTQGSFLMGGGATLFQPRINSTESSATIDCTLMGGIPGVNGSGVAVTIQFQVRALGGSVLGLSNVTLLDSFEHDIAYTSVDGEFMTIL